MTIRERKKALSSVETTERYLKNRWDKLETEEEIINQPLNEDVSVCDPEMRQYFPRIFVSLQAHLSFFKSFFIRFTTSSWFCFERQSNSCSIMPSISFLPITFSIGCLNSTYGKLRNFFFIFFNF